MTTFPSAESTESLQPAIDAQQTNIAQAQSDANTSISYGVDWSDRARPTSHCWLPVTSENLASNELCADETCRDRKSTLLRCESCALVLHAHHLNDLHEATATSLPSCRVSFVDDDDDDTSFTYDRHFWSRVPILAQPCAHCQRLGTSPNLFGTDFMMPIVNMVDQVTLMMENLNPQASESLSGFVCSWCSRGYHRSCWELVNENSRTACDYGIFQNIIVRPQWLHRFSGSPAGFRAQLSPSSGHSSYTPVLLFINKRSGGQVGEKIYRQLLRKLNPRQIFLLENNDTITRALEIYAPLANLRICVFGGDGTVGWVLGRLAELYPSSNNPPVSICPLGTGNDLSRVLTWGEEYDSKRLQDTLLQTAQARAVPLDRWQVHLEEIDPPPPSTSGQSHIDRLRQLFVVHPKFVHDTNRASYPNHHDLPNTRFINYMSFGLDAAIALDFHDQRTRHPSKFSSPLKNKLMYLNETGKYLNDFARANMWDLKSYIRLICDGRDFTDDIHQCHTLVVLNIPGYAAGTNPWGRVSSTAGADDQQDFGDRKIEVVGLNTAHMATIHVGLRGKRIAQCRQLRVELACPMTAQMDGEPFYLSASMAVNISHAGQVLVLRNGN